MITETRDSGKKYLTVLADGKFHQTVPEGTEGAVIREYEDKDEQKKTKTELIFDSVSGSISNISFEDGDFGKNLNIELDGDGVVSLGTSSSFGEDLMKKLPNINLSKPIKLSPYAFTAEGKSRKGITVYQDDEKIESYYFDKDKGVAVNGIPQPQGDTTKYDSDDWKMHFMTVRKFLIKEVEKLIGVSDVEPAVSLDDF